MTKTVLAVALVGAVAFPACDSLGQAMTSHTDVVARAAGHELTIDEAAALLAENPSLPAQPEVVEALANLWVDYILLATEVARDSTLESLDLGPLIQQELDQAVVWKLRDQVIVPDTTFSEEELRRLYEEESPGLQVHARHILLSVPPDATPEQRDSVRAQIEQIRQRAAGGEDFAALAAAFSQDRSNAAQGGDLDFFGKGQMVGPFEEAAFALQPGEVSGVVETPFGYHVIKVEERRLPSFEDVRPDFTFQLKTQRVAEAEDTYISGLIDPLSPEVEGDAADVARELAASPETQLSRRAASRPLVSYRGGAFTAGDFQDLMRRFTVRQRGGLASASDEQVENALRDLTRNKILVEKARAEGLALTEQERDSLVSEARRQLRSATSLAGLTGFEPQQGESRDDAIDRVVKDVLAGIVRGERSVVPLGPIAYALREEHSADLNQRTFPQVVERVQASRPPMPQGMPGQPQQGVPQPMPGQPPQGVPQPMPGQGQVPPGGGR
ncbi:MAG TPA: peptidylprolyl isomerase [Longimicrobiales bacterium]|nr:peptidylprolyl isomerase [Longimicrobiales bacterium]